MKAYGVPWSSPIITHPLHSHLYNRGRIIGLVSRKYSLIQDASCKTLHILHVWSSELKHYIAGDSLDWEKIWSSIVYASKNPDHQQIHLSHSKKKLSHETFNISNLHPVLWQIYKLIYAYVQRVLRHEAFLGWGLATRFLSFFFLSFSFSIPYFSFSVLFSDCCTCLHLKTIKNWFTKKI